MNESKIKKIVEQEEDVFRLEIPTANEASVPATDQVTTQVATQVTTQVATQVLRFCNSPKKAVEIMALLNLKGLKNFKKNYLKPLLMEQLLTMTIPDKPQSSKQKYAITNIGKTWLEKNKK